MRLLLAALIIVSGACSRADSSASADASTPAVQIAAAQPAAASPHAPAAAGAPTASSGVTAVVYKDANCGCCSKWVDHLRAAGFNVVANDVTNLDEIKRRHAIPQSLYSCHTAEIGDYVVEGHVPADLIQKMLQERPKIAGIAVGGMPVGSPGMEGGYSEPYDVVAFTKSGTTSVYAKR